MISGKKEIFKFIFQYDNETIGEELEKQAMQLEVFKKFPFKKGSTVKVKDLGIFKIDSFIITKDTEEICVNIIDDNNVKWFVLPRDWYKNFLEDVIKY